MSEALNFYSRQLFQHTELGSNNGFASSYVQYVSV